MGKYIRVIIACMMAGGLPFCVGASTSSAGVLHFIEFNDAGIDIALRNDDVGQVSHDPEECGSNFVFRLLSSHANYEALSGVLLTYYYSKHPVSVTVTGCSSDMPVVVQIESVSQ